MSANLVVDLANTVVAEPSIPGSAPAFPCSGAIVGAPVDLMNANTYCNLYVAGGLSQSGVLRVLVQTSPSTTSGAFTDPTSGLQVMPSNFSSGGVFVINSGGAGLISGFMDFSAFQRNFRYARCIALSGDFWTAALQAGFISQLRTVGSGGGSSMLPSSGAVRV